MRRSITIMLRAWLVGTVVVVSFCIHAPHVHAQSSVDAPSAQVNEESRVGTLEAREPTGYGWLLLRMVLVLAAVCAIAYIVLRWGVKRFVSSDRSGEGMEVLARLPIEPKRSILVVRIGERHLVIGSSEAGMTSLGELDDDDLSAFVEKEKKQGGPSFREILSRTRGDTDASDEDVRDGEETASDDEAAVQNEERDDLADETDDAADDAAA